MTYTKLSELEQRFDGANDTATLNKLVFDINEEMTRTLELLHDMDKRAERDALYDERYELKKLRNAVRMRATHIVKKRMETR